MDDIKNYEAGQRIISKGEKADAAYLILSGKVRVFLEEGTRTVELATLGEDEIFGETAIFSGQAYGANVEAIEDSELLLITRDSLNSMLENADPTIRALIRMLIERLKNANESLLKRETSEYMDIGFV